LFVIYTKNLNDNLNNKLLNHYEDDNMFFKEYIIEPLKYAYSDLKRIFIGGVLYLLALLGIIFGMLNVILSIIIISPEISENLPLSLSVFKSFAFGALVINSSISAVSLLLGIIFIVFGIVIMCILSGYTYRVINYTLDGKNTIPRWRGCKYLFFKGFIFLMGLFILSIVFNLPNILLRVGVGMMYPEYFGIFPTPAPLYIVLLSAILSIIRLTISLLEWIYTPLAVINFTKKDNFLGFFQITEIISKVSFEYVGILMFVIFISTIYWITCFTVLAIVTITVILTFNYPTGIITAVMLGCFTIPFLAFYLRIFRYRAYAKYYKNRM